VIEEILPAAVSAEESFADLDSETFFPEEEAVVAQAVAERRSEFATSRHCARTALRRLGVTPAPILPGACGAPRWPAGIVGSITHCAGYRAVAVAHSRDVVTIGIDAEPHDPLPDGVLDAIALDSERAMLGCLADASTGVCWDRLLFSAKESVYKAWYPLTARWLDFAAAEVAIDSAAQRFVAKLQVPDPVAAGRRWQEFNGRYVIRHGLVVTAISVVPQLGADPGL
jgi:4'-phosphopantetheinyl transferase EntD